MNLCVYVYLIVDSFSFKFSINVYTYLFCDSNKSYTYYMLIPIFDIIVGRASLPLRELCLPSIELCSDEVIFGRNCRPLAYNCKEWGIGFCLKKTLEISLNLAPKKCELVYMLMFIPLIHSIVLLCWYVILTLSDWQLSIMWVVQLFVKWWIFV